MSVAEIIQFLDSFAPLVLAADWDNVGLLLGDRRAACARVMTCLTLTPDVAAEAIRERVDLIVSHHPILFKAVKRLTGDDPQGAMLLDLIRADVAVFSPHTAFDSARFGINQQLAISLDLRDILPLRPDAGDPTVGTGRWGSLPVATSLDTVARRLAQTCGVLQLQLVGDLSQTVQRVGIACGAAAEFLSDARRAGCEVFVTGEARFHDCLEARTRGIGLILLGHYGSERPAVESLAQTLARQFPSLTVWASHVERNPVSDYQLP